jgi:hypothetical protein
LSQHLTNCFKILTTFQIKEETNQIVVLMCVVWNEENKKQKTKQRDKQKREERGYRTLLRLFLPTHLHQINKFLRTIWRNFWCQSFISAIPNQIIVITLFRSQQNKCQIETSISTNLPNSNCHINHIFIFVRFSLCNNFIN